MKLKMKIKVIIDLLMTILLLLLMAFQITGQEFHEWFGAGMLALFLAHNILNFKWYKSLFKGKYSIVRVLRVTVNFTILFSILCLAYSGTEMVSFISGYGRTYVTDDLAPHCGGGVDLVADFCASGIHAGGRGREVRHDDICGFYVDIPRWGGVSVRRASWNRSTWRMAGHGM